MNDKIRKTLPSLSMKTAALLCLLSASTAASAQAWNNKPWNTDVKLTETNLPIVFINVKGKEIKRDDRITARMKIIDNGEGQLNYGDTIKHPKQNVDYDGYIALRYRGNSSYDAPKKPYSFRTLEQTLEEGGKKQKVKLLGMPKDNNWALQAPYSDKTNMRDLLAYNLAAPWMEFTPEGRFCELILDGTYYGVHVLQEVVSKGKNRLNLDDPGTSGDELTGGYMVEVDRNDEEVFWSSYNPVDNFGNTYGDKGICFQYKEPDYEDMTATQRNYIRQRVKEMENTLASANYTDEEKGYRKVIDAKSFIDYQLSKEFGHDVDAYRLSCKLYKRRDSQDPRFKLAIWDMNLAYGNSDYHDGWRTDTWCYRMNNVLSSNGEAFMVPFWWYKLNNDNRYKEELKARWAQYRHHNYTEEHIMEVIDSMAAVLTAHGAVDRDNRAWYRYGNYAWPNKYVGSNFNDDVNYMKKWIRERMAWMDKELGYDPNAPYEEPSSVTAAEVATNRTVTDIYSLDGRMVDTPRRGIYIVRYSDGTTRKVMF